MIGSHIVFGYFKIGRVITLSGKQFLLFTPFEWSKALRILNVRFALVMVTFMRCKSVSFGSKVIPRVFGCSVVGSV